MRQGSTLIEILITMVVIGILAGLAAPSLHDAAVKADAAHILSDFQTIRVAVMEYYAEEVVVGDLRRARRGFDAALTGGSPIRRYLTQ